MLYFLFYENHLYKRTLYVIIKLHQKILFLSLLLFKDLKVTRKINAYFTIGLCVII